MFKREDILYRPEFESRSGCFQISQGEINEQYIFTLWTFFPRPLQVDREISEHFRFLNNALPKNEAKTVFSKFIIEELPYTEKFFFPVFKSEEKAMDFLESELFNKTFRKYEKIDLE